MYYKTASIILNSGQKSNSVSDIFISQPDIHKESLAGKLFILAEIESQRSEAIKIINFLINNINFNYYQNEKIILKERIESISVENIFETTLAKTNKDLVEFITREKMKISPYAFNMTVCVLYKNELYLSTVGKNKNLLIYREKKEAKEKDKKKTKEEKNEYQLVDVGGTKERRSETVNLNKLFSDVVSGKIPAGGSFLIINEALSEYVSNKQLVRIVTTLSPAGATEQIKNILGKINAFVSFLGIIIKSTTSSLPSDELKEESYQPEIMKLEEKTEEILKPAGIINLKKRFKTLAGKTSFGRAPGQTEVGGEKAKKIFMFKDRVFFKKKTFFLSPKNILLLIIKLIRLILALIVFLFKIFTSKKELGNFINKIKSVTKTIGRKEGTPLSSKKTKIILIVAAIFLIIFVFNLVIIGKRNKAKEEQRIFNALIATVEKNQNKVEANLLYNNEKKARELIEENKELLARISPEEIEKKHFIKELIAKQEEQIEKIRHVIKVEAPKEIANFSNLNSQARAQNIILLGDKIYSADKEERAIYKIDLEEDLVTAIYNLEATIEQLKCPTLGPSDNIYYLDKDSIVELNKKEEISNLKIEIPEIANVSNIFSYSNKIYLIDKKDGQIYRYSRINENFLNKEGWFEQEKDLTKAVDLFIDGNIYILYQNGLVEKYLKGKQEEFSLQSLYLPIENALSLKVTQNHIYILEPGQKRLIIFDSEGKFQKQYVFPSLEDIKDLSLNEEEKKAYILDNNSVYEIGLE